MECFWKYRVKMKIPFFNVKNTWSFEEHDAANNIFNTFAVLVRIYGGQVILARRQEIFGVALSSKWEIIDIVEGEES